MCEINVEKNKFLGGYCAYFFKNGRKYYADVAAVPRGLYTECMIFPVREDGEISWADVYCKRDIPVTKESLLKCIDEFMERPD